MVWHTNWSLLATTGTTWQRGQYKCLNTTSSQYWAKWTTNHYPSGVTYLAQQNSPSTNSASPMLPQRYRPMPTSTANMITWGSPLPPWGAQYRPMSNLMFAEHGTPIPKLDSTLEHPGTPSLLQGLYCENKSNKDKQHGILQASIHHKPQSLTWNNGHPSCAATVKCPSRKHSSRIQDSRSTTKG